MCIAVEVRHTSPTAPTVPFLLLCDPAHTSRMLEWSAQVATHDRSQCGCIVVDFFLTCIFISLKFLAMVLALPMVKLALLVEQISMKEEWRSATVDSGEQFVMTYGRERMQEWLADSLATLGLVGFKFTAYVGKL